MQQQYSFTDPVIELKHVKKKFPNGYVCPKDISLQFWGGEITLITGGNGSGKSTLLKILGFMESATSGDVGILGYNLKSLNVFESRKLQSHVEYIHQQAFGLRKGSALWNVQYLAEYEMKTSEAHHSSLEALERVQTTKRFDIRTDVMRLSGGEKARVALALALIRCRPICLVDEIFSGVDYASYGPLMDLFHELANKGICIIIVSHSRDLEQLADRVVTLEDGKVLKDERKASALMLKSFWR